MRWKWRILGLLIWTTSFVSAQTATLPDSASSITDSTISQTTVLQSDSAFLDSLIMDNDTLDIHYLNDVVLAEMPHFDDYNQRRAYYILRRKVLKVYPYAKLASEKLTALEKELEGIKSKRKRRKHVKKMQKYLEEEFEEDLKKFTRTEGQILCKLIYRETDKTTYEIVKETRSGWTAFWWQTTAKWFDITLKAEYHPDIDEQDAWIENIIVRAINDGLIKP